jgi:hypothetical protein
MGRRPFLLLAILLVGFSAATATGMQASTECEKWLQGYKTSLVQAKAARRLAAAKRRAKQKLAGYVAPKAKPKPKLLPTGVHRPRLSREEMLRKFEVACGELPDAPPPENQLASNDVKPFVLPERSWPNEDGVDLAPGDETGFLPNMDSPVYTSSYSDSPSDNGGPGYAGPGFSGPGGGGGYLRGGSSNPPPGSPGTTNTPPGVAPEPSSIVLMLTGIAGAAGIVRRRFQS